MKENTVENTEEIQENTTPEAQDADLSAPEAPDEAQVPLDDSEPSESDSEDAETFPREYVEKLRRESAGYRDKAKRADEYAQRLHTALVEATGLLADPQDLAFNEEHLEHPEQIVEAVQSLLTERPHLASRKPVGSIGQGVRPVSAPTSLGSLLRAGAQ